MQNGDRQTQPFIVKDRIDVPVGHDDQSSSGVNIAVASCHGFPVTLLLSGDVGLRLVTRHVVAEGVRHGRPTAAIITAGAGHYPLAGAHWPGPSHDLGPGPGPSAAVEHVQEVPPALCLPAVILKFRRIKRNKPCGSSALTSATLMLVTSPPTPPPLVTGKLRKMLSLAGMLSWGSEEPVPMTVSNNAVLNIL